MHDSGCSRVCFLAIAVPPASYASSTPRSLLACACQRRACVIPAQPLFIVIRHAKVCNQTRTYS